MSSDLQRVAQGLVECLDQVPQVVAHLQRTAARCRENGAIAGQLGATTAAHQLDAAACACEAAAHYLSKAPPKARAWAIGLTGAQVDDTKRTASESADRNPLVGSGSEESTTRPVGGGLTSDKASPGDDDVTANRGSEPSPEPDTERSPGSRGSEPGGDFDPIELLKLLPKREVGPGRRAKTRGVWRDDSGKDHQLVSGQHEEDYQAAQRFAERLGLVTSPNLLSTAADVELKFAMRMRREGIMDVRIVLNNEPCTGRLSCQALLKRFLPAGSRLTVYAPDFDFEETYEGEAETDGNH
ncbi:DddA-like double-stranded DNA deaminase toxin [Kribbella sp. NPDC058245]|uniref:DddA-like double-stranded DNA deaminase toxin n=1 Tax=Kribbella sp. NPDC058245 TaxID=3346399 RepID=UPI0036E71116